MILDVVQQGNDLTVPFWKVLVSIAHVEVVDAIAMNEAGLNKWRVLTSDIDVMLRFNSAAEWTRRGVPLAKLWACAIQSYICFVCRPFCRVKEHFSLVRVAINGEL